MALDDGAVVVPIGGIDPDGVTTPRVIDVPEAWNGWLLYAYGESLGYLDRTPAASVIEARLRESGRGPAAMPPMPVCPAAVEVARRVLTDVAGFSSLAEEAARAGWSVRTLQRRFRAETGLSVTEWVRRARLGVAADLLAAGRDPEWVAHRGRISDGEWIQPGVLGEDRGDPRALAPGRSDGGGHGHGDEPAPPLPAQRTWTRVNGAAVAVWVARGQATVTVGERCHHLRAGHALVLPAGIPNRIRTGAESLVIPVGFRPGGGGVGATVRPAEFGPEEQWRLLEASVACYTGLPVRGAADGVDLVLSGAQWEPASADDRLLADLANALAWGDDPQDRALGQWAAAFGVSESRIRRAVREATGMGFAHWQRLARMSSARSRLLHGGSVGKVARDLGYAHVSGFSRAFRAVHGAPPGRCTARKAG